MNQENYEPIQNDEIHPEYDFAPGARGKHHVQYKQVSNIVVLDADIAEVFHDAASVNEALRMLVRIAKEQTHISRSA